MRLVLVGLSGALCPFGLTFHFISIHLSIGIGTLQVVFRSILAEHFN